MRMKNEKSEASTQQQNKLRIRTPSHKAEQQGALATIRELELRTRNKQSRLAAQPQQLGNIEEPTYPPGTVQLGKGGKHDNENHENRKYAHDESSI